jgi:hypothetical protein
MTAAIIYGGVLGIAAGIGTFGSGVVADRVRGQHPNSDSWLPAIGMTACVPLMIFGYNTVAFSSGATAIWLAIPVLAIAAVLRYTYLAPMFAVTQKLVEPRMRATAAALLLFVVNLVGYGLGPPAVGWISDQGTKYQLAQLESPVSASQCGAIERSLLATRKGRDGALSGDALAEAVANNDAYCKPARAVGNRTGVSVGSLFLLWAALHFYLMGRTMKRDLWTPDESPATA